MSFMGRYIWRVTQGTYKSTDEARNWRKATIKKIGIRQFKRTYYTAYKLKATCV